MPYLKIYDLFISHAWTYNYDYYKLVDILRKAPCFYFRNYSVPKAEDILSSDLNADLRCNCISCNSGYNSLSRNAKNHFLHVRTTEINKLNALDSTKQRLTWFSDRVTKAIAACDRIRKQQTYKFQAGQYSHLKAWLQVFNVA